MAEVLSLSDLKQLPFTVTVTTGKNHVGTLIEETDTLGGIVESCTSYEVGEKDGTAIIPAVFNPCTDPCRNAAKARAARARGDRAYDCGGGSIHRLSANVAEMTMLGVDLDGITLAVMDKITDALAARGLCFIAWTTHSHAPPNDCRFRLLLPFSEPLPLTSPGAWSKVAWPALIKELGLPRSADVSCSNPDRIYYLPRKPDADAVRPAGFNPGRLLDWRPIVGAALETMCAAALAEAPEPVEQDPARPVDLAAIRAQLAKIKRPVDAARCLQRVLAGEAPSPPPEGRAPGELSRHVAWFKVTGLIANAAEGWESSTALLEILRPAYAAEVRESPADHTEWSVIENHLESARDSAPEYKAQKKAEEAGRREMFTRALRARAGALGKPEAPATGAEPTGTEWFATEPVFTAPVPVEITEAEQAARNLTDAGNAKRFHAQHKEHLRYVHEWGMWLHWNGHRWQRDAGGAVVRFAMQTARQIYAEAADTQDADQKAKLAAHAAKSESARALDAMMRLARALLGIDPARLDSAPYLFNCENGTIDLRTGELGPQRQSDLITKSSPIAFDPAATAPAWDAFFARIFRSKPELLEFVQRAVGYALTGEVSEQVLIFLHGAGSNGKSTFLTTLQHVFGDYAKQGAPDLLLSSQNDKHPTEQADVMGARLVVCSEVEQGRTFSEVTVKQLTGGDRIKARFMGQDFFEFAPTHKIFLSANHRPRVRGQDHAIWRRFRLIPFTETITEAEKDPDLGSKLRAEAPGILAWAVRGAVSWHRQRLGPPAEVVEATKSYRTEQDRIGAFVDEACERTPGERCTSADLYRAYVRWCSANGETPWSGRSFSEALGERGFDPYRTNSVRGWVGLKVRSGPPGMLRAVIGGTP